MSVLKINGLTKQYGPITALNQLNLTIEAGNIYGLLGPNGSGKTTTLGIILGILSQTSGDFEWFGGKYGDKYRMRIGAILETPNFYPYLNAAKNLQIIQDIKHSYDDDIDGLLEKVNLAHRKKSKFRAYSLGMKQRLAIAATLIGDPDVVIFDEPTNGLDPEGIAEVRKILKKVADSGKTVIMASHLLDEVEKICSHVAIIKEGQLLATGPVGSILSNDITVEVSATDMDKLFKIVSDVSWIYDVKREKEMIEFQMDDNHTAQEINFMLYKENVILNHLVSRKRKLEEEFLEITNK
ncbi:MAG: ATP-binding cassette domain-containing protein [Saprospiraceae bacterium]|nr:ATP-binding cassette domain-containing protein [Saprospiraceae bacterium]